MLSNEEKLMVRKAYIQAISKESYMPENFEKDIYIGGQAPGNWMPYSILEIYCENDIPNATDIYDFSEFGGGTFYNCDLWDRIDKRANEIIALQGRSDIKTYCEPKNSAVIGIYEV